MSQLFKCLLMSMVNITIDLVCVCDGIEIFQKQCSFGSNVALDSTLEVLALLKHFTLLHVCPSEALFISEAPSLYKILLDFFMFQLYT